MKKTQHRRRPRHDRIAPIVIKVLRDNLGKDKQNRSHHQRRINLRGVFAHRKPKQYHRHKVRRKVIDKVVPDQHRKYKTVAVVHRLVQKRIQPAILFNTKPKTKFAKPIYPSLGPRKKRAKQDKNKTH